MWNKDEVEGKADQIKGRIKQSAGDLNDDERLREEGEADEMSGKVKEGFGEGRRKLGNAIKNVGDQIKK